jgi:hypothetical protein
MKNSDSNTNSLAKKRPNTLSKTSINFQVTKTFTVLALFLISMLTSSCELIGGVFRLGVGVGVLIVAVVIAVIVAIAMRAGKK